MAYIRESAPPSPPPPSGADHEFRFPLGTEKTGHKVDAAAVARMRYKKNEVGNRLFAADEFLKPQQVHRYFSRMAAKLKNRHDGDITEEEITAAEEDGAYFTCLETVRKKAKLAVMSN